MIVIVLIYNRYSSRCMSSSGFVVIKFGVDESYMKGFVVHTVVWQVGA